jgi:hypothetical protein
MFNYYAGARMVRRFLDRWMPLCENCGSPPLLRTRKIPPPQSHPEVYAFHCLNIQREQQHTHATSTKGPDEGRPAGAYGSLFPLAIGSYNADANANARFSCSRSQGVEDVPWRQDALRWVACCTPVVRVVRCPASRSAHSAPFLSAPYYLSLTCCLPCLLDTSTCTPQQHAPHPLSCGM